MFDKFTISFALELVLITFLLYILFFGYCRLAPRNGELGGLPAGFIYFLAANEIISLPFILFHWSFRLYWLIFLAVNLTVLFYGIVNLRFLRPGIRTGLGWPAILTSLLCVGLVLSASILTQVFSRYDADDSFYVSLVQQNKDSSRLYSNDPSTGDLSLPFPKTYALDSWELIESAFSKSFGLSGLEVAHSLIPFMLPPIVFLLYHQIYRKYLRSVVQVNLAIIFSALILFYSGFSLYSQGIFLMTRAWQGKAILAVLILPALIYLLAEAYRSPGQKRLYRNILLVNVAAIALSPASVFLTLAAMVSASICILAKWKNKKHIINLAVALSPAIIAGLLLAIFTKITSRLPGEGQIASAPSYLGYAKAFFHASFYFYLYLASAIFIYLRWARNDATRFLSLFFPATLLLSFLNPIFFQPIASSVAYDTYWRFWWLMPLILVIPIAAAEAVFTAAAAFKKFGALIQGAAFTASAAIAVIIIVLSGANIFDPSLVNKDTSKSKLPLGVIESGEWLSKSPRGNVLASYGPATYLRGVSSKDTLVLSRPEYLSVYFTPQSQIFSDKTALYKYMNGLSRMPSLEFQRLLSKYRVRYLVFNDDDRAIESFVENSGYPIVHTNAEYKISEIGPGS